jgi:predicted RNase H-like nuclease (RuvC/YqgF family)
VSADALVTLHALYVQAMQHGDLSADMQAKQDEAPGNKQQLDAEAAAHAETRSKLATLKATLERKTALANELRAKLDDLQKGDHACAHTGQALQQAQQQLKEANAALAREKARVKEVRWLHLIDTLTRMLTITNAAGRVAVVAVAISLLQNCLCTAST